MSSLTKKERKCYLSVPIMKAAMLNDVNNIRRIITEDGNAVNYCHISSGDTPLIVAARHKSFEVLKELLNFGAKIECFNIDGKRSLHEAAYNGCLLCVEFLLNQGAQVDPLKRADWTPLMLACTKGNLDIVKLLVNAGANVQRKNKDGWTSFHISCREGFIDVMDYLVCIDNTLCFTVSNNKRTPLHTSSMHGKIEAVKFLLEKGCNPDVRDSCGSSPLMDALRFGFVSVAEVLIKTNLVLLDQVDNLGRYPLHIAAESGQVDSVKYLVEKLNVDINLKTKNSGYTVFHLIAKEGHLELLNYLVNDQSVNRCFKYLLNEPDASLRTPLHLSVASNKVRFAKMLIELKCDQTLKDKYDKLAVNYALSQEMRDVVQIDLHTL
ncbi:ankyrin repeat domain-containing protein 16 [Hydra vulgaris]|uniref:Ankyrin repeat domain-containing protein 16 n=1 Tax=Hydra vulgaris TaxID=6087 RepID=A0ABM4B815_HYDVU